MVVSYIGVWKHCTHEKTTDLSQVTDIIIQNKTTDLSQVTDIIIQNKTVDIKVSELNAFLEYNW
jgi:hypothetical protein